MNILSIQSWVADGHVGNAAALFPLQRLGAHVASINTVQFSNHPGHGRFTGHAMAPEDIASLVDGLAAHGTLAACDAVLSGYLGSAPVGGVILDAVARARAARPGCLWCCDPVMGDDGAFYVRPGIPEFFRDQAVRAADIVVPNQFELSVLTGAACGTWDEAKSAAVSLRARMRPTGPQVVLVTSLQGGRAGADTIDMLLASDAGTFRLQTEKLPRKFSGAGDTLAALFLFHVLAMADPAAAAQRAAASVAGLLRRTWQAGAAELLLVDAQDEFVAPTGVVTCQAA